MSRALDPSIHNGPPKADESTGPSSPTQVNEFKLLPNQESPDFLVWTGLSQHEHNASRPSPTRV